MIKFDIEDEIRQAARDRMSFYEWWMSKDINFRVKNHNLRAKLKRKYLIEEAAAAAALPDTVRCVLFVYGDTNTGKSYATRQYFRQLYSPKPGKVIDAAGQGSGAFDKVTLGTDAIVFDNVFKGEGLTKDVVRLCNDGKPLLHRRYNGDVAYVGKYTVIITLDSPQEWLKDLGNKYWDKKNGKPADAGEALLARLAKIHVHEDGNDIVVDPPVYSTCGSEEAQYEKKVLADKYVDFLRKSCRYYAEHWYTPYHIAIQSK